MPHKLRIEQKDDSALLHATLTISKPQGTQNISFDLPPCIGFGRFVRSWEAQGEDWIEISREERDGIFTAIRLILILDSNLAILWRVVHFQDKPFDAAGIEEFTPAFMARVKAMK